MLTSVLANQSSISCRMNLYSDLMKPILEVTKMRKRMLLISGGEQKDKT